MALEALDRGRLIKGRGKLEIVLNNTIKGQIIMETNQIISSKRQIDDLSTTTDHAGTLRSGNRGNHMHNLHMKIILVNRDSHIINLLTSSLAELQYIFTMMKIALLVKDIMIMIMITNHVVTDMIEIIIITITIIIVGAVVGMLCMITINKIQDRCKRKRIKTIIFWLVKAFLTMKKYIGSTRKREYIRSTRILNNKGKKVLCTIKGLKIEMRNLNTLNLKQVQLSVKHMKTEVSTILLQTKGLRPLLFLTLVQQFITEDKALDNIKG